MRRGEERAGEAITHLGQAHSSNEGVVERHAGCSYYSSQIHCPIKTQKPQSRRSLSFFFSSSFFFLPPLPSLPKKSSEKTAKLSNLWELVDCFLISTSAGIIEEIGICLKKTMRKFPKKYIHQITPHSARPLALLFFFFFRLFGVVRKRHRAPASWVLGLNRLWFIKSRMKGLKPEWYH